MFSSKKRFSAQALAESGLLIAAAYILSFVKFSLPQGGSVTAMSMLPLIIIGLRRGPFWGICSGLVYGVLQMLPPQQFYAPPAKTFLAYVLVITLDYLVAFGVMGLSGFFRGRKNSLLISVPVCYILRFLCHFASGILVWSSYAGDTPVWLYSFIYNGSYMGVELVLGVIAGYFLQKNKLLEKFM